MSLPEDFLDHARQLLTPKFNDGDYPSEVSLRRSVSASYYALFYQIVEDSASLIAPHVAPEIRNRIRRWFDHTEMKRVCGRFSKPGLEHPLLGLIGQAASDDLREVASTFIKLQEDRHGADYDLNYRIDADDAHEKLVSAVFAIEAWKRIKMTAEANIFILSLLMWKNWEDKSRT